MSRFENAHTNSAPSCACVSARDIPLYSEQQQNPSMQTNMTHVDCSCASAHQALDARYASEPKPFDFEVFFACYPIVCAPMAGVSDVVYRQLALQAGASLAYTEMVSTKGLEYHSEKTLDLIALGAHEPYVAVQIFGHDASVMAHEAAFVQEHLGTHLAYIDINMGCPARKIVSKGDGSALMEEPARAASIVRAVSDSVSCAVGVKFRRGYYLDRETCVSFAQRMEQSGASLLTVHGRYAQQMYRGVSSRAAIARVKATVSIPVIGNGDVRGGADAIALYKETNCDGIMIARASQGNPWVFRSVRNAIDAYRSGTDIPHDVYVSPAERLECARTHARMLAQFDFPLKKMRSYAMWYVSGLPGATHARARICSCLTLQDYLDVFDELECQLASTSEQTSTVCLQAAKHSASIPAPTPESASAPVHERAHENEHVTSETCDERA